MIRFPKVQLLPCQTLSVAFLACMLGRSKRPGGRGPWGEELRVVSCQKPARNREALIQQSLGTESCQQ